MCIDEFVVREQLLMSEDGKIIFLAKTRNGRERSICIYDDETISIKQIKLGHKKLGGACCLLANNRLAVLILPKLKTSMLTLSS